MLSKDDLLKRRAELSRTKQAILEKRLRGEIKAHAGSQKIPCIPRTDDLPLSSAQQRMWFLDRLAPDNLSYNIPAVVWLAGALNVAALAWSLQQVVRRHEVLRTTFALNPETRQPVQLIAPDLVLDLPVLDLRSTPEHATEAARSFIRQPFDLQHGPLLRATLLQLADADYWLVLTLHHSVSDGWSLGVLVQEVATLYTLRRSGLSQAAGTGLPDLAIQYADYAVWQRNWLSGAEATQQLEYWLGQLKDAPAILDLPTDRPRPPTQTFHGALYNHRIEPELTRELAALSQREGVTLFVTLLAAFNVLLARYSGQYDLLVGTPIAGRRHTELENLIGVFVNTLVLRADLTGNPSFRQLLGRLDRTTQAAYEHQDLPLEQIVDALKLDRDLSRTPLFQVLFAFQNAPIPTVNSRGIRFNALHIDTGVAAFDLILEIYQIDGGLRAAFSYNTDLFDESTIARLGAHWEMLLAQITAHPEEPVLTLPLLTPTEQQQILVDWNQSRVVYGTAQCLHDLVAAQAARTPAATAVVVGHQRLTYDDLLRRANQLAHHLQQLGVGPEVPVAVCLPRSTDLIVAVLGVLIAGGAYVPLDPSYPQERLHYMLEHSRAPLLLTLDHEVANLRPDSSQHQLQVFRLDADWPQIAMQPTSTPSSQVTPDNTAYIIYTSGSTGNPKGVMTPHRAAWNLTLAFVEAFGLTPDDRMLMIPSLSFDASVGDLFPTLASGAILVIHPSPAGLVGLEMRRFCEQHSITIVDIPAAFWQQWLDDLIHQGIGVAPSLRLVISGGESIAIDRLQLWASLTNQCVTFIGPYGPTEATVCTTFYTTVDGSETRAGSMRLPIGHPVANTEVYILDPHLQPVPIGVPGEVYIGGVGLAPGYLHRPDLTAEKFGPHPFAGQPLAVARGSGERLYRTGDLARWLPEGNIEFLGRVDQQVKLRGFRIELGEIEATLRLHPDVREAIALVRDDTGDRRLVAYVVPQPDATLSTRELRSLIKAKLPEYMIPAAFMLLDALPVTRNGKVDRRALPVPIFQLDPETEVVAPRTPLEQAIAAIWAEMLVQGTETIGINHNFFELGGHSLLATQVVARIQDAVQVQVPVRSIFEAPTIAELAALIATQTEAATAPLSPPIQPVSRETPLPLSFAQLRLWFLQQLQPQSTVYNLPILIRLIGQIDLDALQYSLDALAARHEVLRTTFVADTTAYAEPQQYISPPDGVQVSQVMLRDAANETALSTAIQEAIGHNFDLHQGPLLRVTLIQHHATEHTLVLLTHHIIFDGWSQTILLRDLAALYQRFAQHEAVSVPDMPLHYADYAVWQRQWLQGALLEEQLSYWKAQLSELSPVELPTDHPRPAVFSERGTQVFFDIPDSTVSALQQLSLAVDATLFMTLLTGFQIVLARYSGHYDIVVGTPIAGRVRPELESMVGCFINTLVLRTDLGGAPTYAEAIRRVRDAALGAYSHQDLPFEMLVEQLQPQRDLSRHPLFQIMFVLQNLPFETITLPDLTLEPVAVESQVAKFDLTLDLIETEAGLRGRVEYCTDLFKAGTIERLIGHYQRVLELMIADPQQPINHVSVLTTTERQQILEIWNATAAAYPQDQCLHDLFVAQAARVPAAIAITCGDRQLTYRELNQCSNQIAHYLRSRGVGAETRVAVCLDRSLDLASALLGVLKAGGAYIPLDPSYPAERIQFMLADSQVPLLITSSQIRDGLGLDDTQHTAQVLCLDSEWPVITQQCADDPRAVGRPDNLAYMIYTSGSTGQPKGVMIPHSAVVNFLRSMEQEPGLSAGDTLVAVTTLSFDIAGLELFLPLSVGARIVLARREETVDGHALAALLRDANATVLQATPATWRVLLDSGWSPPDGFKMLCGGESLPLDLAQHLSATGGELWNMYGPTETTIWSSVERIGPESTQISIGRPIANTAIYLLDQCMQPVPIGVPGRLYIGGAGLARGYLGRTELTAERFIPNPFGENGHSQGGTRIYWTGDLARYLPDGRIEHLGRIDDQVKLRGFRIELGEIESVLAQHPSVRQAVVAARDLGSQDKRLVAYIVPAGPSEPSTNELRGFVQTLLPDYMVPSIFLVLDALPLSPSGKVDRKALPDPQGHRPQLTADYIAPRNVMEQQIAAIWQEVLQVEKAGIHDNFFDLGGHSLLMIRVHSQMRATLNVDVSMVMLFTYPTISALAQHLTEAAPVPALFTEAPEDVEARNQASRRRRQLRQSSWTIDE